MSNCFCDSGSLMQKPLPQEQPSFLLESILKMLFVSLYHILHLKAKSPQPSRCARGRYIYIDLLFEICKFFLFLCLIKRLSLCEQFHYVWGNECTSRVMPCFFLATACSCWLFAYLFTLTNFNFPYKMASFIGILNLHTIFLIACSWRIQVWSSFWSIYEKQ